MATSAVHKHRKNSPGLSIIMLTICLFLLVALVLGLATCMKVLDCKCSKEEGDLWPNKGCHATYTSSIKG